MAIPFAAIGGLWVLVGLDLSRLSQSDRNAIDREIGDDAFQPRDRVASS